MNELAEIRKFDLTKKEVEEFASGACYEIVNGKQDILEVSRNLKAIKMFVDIIEKYIKSHVLDEAMGFGKSFEYKGAKYEVRYRNSFDFKSDPTWRGLKEQITERENLLKNLKEPIVIENTGEVINPPLHKQSEYIVIGLK